VFLWFLWFLCPTTDSRGAKRPVAPFQIWHRIYAIEVPQSTLWQDWQQRAEKVVWLTRSTDTTLYCRPSSTTWDRNWEHRGFLESLESGIHLSWASWCSWDSGRLRSMRRWVSTQSHNNMPCEHTEVVPTTVFADMCQTPTKNLCSKNRNLHYQALPWPERIYQGFVTRDYSSFTSSSWYWPTLQLPSHARSRPLRYWGAARAQTHEKYVQVTNNHSFMHNPPGSSLCAHALLWTHWRVWQLNMIPSHSNIRFGLNKSRIK